MQPPIYSSVFIAGILRKEPRLHLSGNSIHGHSAIRFHPLRHLFGKT